ncbi:MAG: hypothetical protein J6Q30_02790 [Oscillospiraceae bacterium]|nr:hypothetical protein [Oscillospiraceae bacterium]
MTKLLSVLLAMAVLLGLSACGNNASPAAQSTETNNVQTSVPGYGFVFQGVILIPGDAFAADKLSEPQYIYTQTNSVLGGKDTFYNYTDIEVVVYDDGKTAVIRSVMVLSPNLKTSEGMALGDPLEHVTKLYGNSYTQIGDEWLFTKEKTVLAILTQDGFVAGIEYRLTENNL